MCRKTTAIAALALTLLPLAGAPAQEAAAKAAPSPGELAAAAPDEDWVDIAPDDLLVMTLAPDAAGKARTVLIQLMPPPFAQGWVENIRTMARAHYYDGNAIYRVQDNYVAQWGDPAEDEAGAKPRPEGLTAMQESDYTLDRGDPGYAEIGRQLIETAEQRAKIERANAASEKAMKAGKSPLAIALPLPPLVMQMKDSYAEGTLFSHGWPLGAAKGQLWPVHCYGAVGVARGQRPDTGDGSVLYAVIGHAPRHLDRNIALAGRVVEGIEHLSSLPRGTEALGFYKDMAEATPVLAIGLASDLPADAQPHIQYLSTESASFAAYADARANRRDPFFLVPAGGADICNIPVPIRRKP